MTKITLAGQPWRVHSPSFLQHDTSPLWMAYKLCRQGSRNTRFELGERGFATALNLHNEKPTS